MYGLDFASLVITKHLVTNFETKSKNTLSYDVRTA